MLFEHLNFELYLLFEIITKNITKKETCHALYKLKMLHLECNKEKIKNTKIVGKLYFIKR